jgi:glucose/arabinose dehydrogenase
VTRLACLLLLLPAVALAAEPAVVLKGLKKPLAVCVVADRTFVADYGGDDDRGGVVELKDGKAVPFADVNRPQTLAAFQRWLFVGTEKDQIFRFDLSAKEPTAELWVSRDDFLDLKGSLTDMTFDERGGMYVSGTGDKLGESVLYSVGAKFGPKGPTRGAVKKVTEAKAVPKEVGFFQAVQTDGLNHVLLFGQSGELARVNVADGKAESVHHFSTGHGSGLCVDDFGRLFALTWDGVWAFPRPGEKPVALFTKKDAVFNGIAYDRANRRLLVAHGEAGAVLALPAQIPGWEVDESPLPVETELAFADVKWTGWDDGSASGKVVPLRPIVLTHANDGSGRTFVATQHGVIHVVEKGAKESKVFLDIQSKCLYRDDQNEQGLLGLAFHPKYKENGEFFVFYTDKAKKLENVVCRFRVSKDDRNKADPASEQELLRISHKYWNHDGGTLAFGPDGFLYIVLGDGGSANDPDDHGQKTDTILGKILRIDINTKSENTPYGIPKDNPFVGKKEYRPEIFALGVRNPWRMSFDRKTGQGWFGEVGQNLWEEINLLEKGANYGWRRRESLHPFGADGTGPKAEFTDPVWEYHHDVGKSITGGHVYRGKELPALEGYYLYADYVSGKLWGLEYDEKAKRVTANRPIAGKNLPILSFGEDEAGEVYLMTYAANGKGIYKFKATK